MSSAAEHSDHPFGRRTYDATSAMVRAETEIAVLHIHMKNIDEKVDELKDDIKAVKDEIKASNDNTISLIKDMEANTREAYDKLSTKVSNLEKWRWMIMGAGIVIGSLGFETLAKLLK